MTTDLIYPNDWGRCAACGCSWDTDLFNDPNAQLDSCPGCDCHTHEFAESRAAEQAQESLEAAWKSYGYATSFEVWQAELR